MRAAGQRMRSYIVRVYGGPSLSGTVQQVADAGAAWPHPRRAAGIAASITAVTEITEITVAALAMPTSSIGDTTTSGQQPAATGPNAVLGFGSGEELLQRLSGGQKVTL
jgi:hypothetical protein